MEKTLNDYEYTAKERAMVQEARDMLISLTDKVNVNTIKRGDLVAILGAQITRYNLLCDRITNPE